MVKNKKFFFSRKEEKSINPLEIKDTFLKLTEYTIPYGHEEKLEGYLPKGYNKDSTGNY